MDDADDDRSSRAPEPDDVIRICRALNEAEARYLVIGGFAVVAHGAGRFTRDIDLLVDDAPANVARVKRALSVLSDNAAAEVADDDVRRYAVVRVADEVVVDLMGRACGLTYADAASDVETLDRGGVSIPVPSPSMLIRLKDTRRPQDAIDRAFLEGVLREREKRR
ncbi:MAG TPA: nucleotidyl transferase AbiEii/AbiGii toxin family protein [Gaiellaceae bacterium]|nr:nucleotidyl transferase AbiEii/AbiGii toxin family protein [Gaiellaceae bacterium]